MLETQANREEKNATKLRNKAKAALRKGNRPFAASYVQQSITAQNHSVFLLENAAQVSAMVCDLRMAEIEKTMAKSLAATVKQLEKSVASLDLEQIANMTYKLDQIRGNANAVHSTITTQEAIGELGEDLMRELMNEIEVESEAVLDDLELPEEKEQEAVSQPAGRAAASI